jgi:hypothetical protein
LRPEDAEAGLYPRAMTVANETARPKG